MTKKSRRQKFATSTLSVAMLAAASIFLQAPPALASCLEWPGTNDIYVDTGDGNIMIIPTATDPASVVCVEVSGNPDPEIGTNLVVKPGVGCGIPCFAVGWDGITTGPVTITITVGEGSSWSYTIPGGSHGSFCINSGIPCN